MKCGAWVVTRPTKKGERRVMVYTPVVDIAAVLRWNEEHADTNLREPYQRKTQEDAKSAVRCDGDIVATVAAADEPYMGGCSAKFEVSYRCTACDCTCYQYLPSSAEGVSAILTATIGGMDGDAARAAYTAREAARIKDAEAWRAKFLREAQEHKKKS